MLAATEGATVPVGSALSSGGSVPTNTSSSGGMGVVLAKKRRSHVSDADYFDSYIPGALSWDSLQVHVAV